MDVKQRSELEALMKDFYGDDATKSKEARDEMIAYGRDLIRAGQVEDYQDLMKVCAGVIAERGIDITKAERVVVGGRAQDGSTVPAPIQLMRDFEKQAREELGELTEGAVEITQTREIVEKLATVLSRQREIIEKIQKDPSSIEKFVAAIDENNKKSEKQIEVENSRLRRFKEYFPDTDALTTINPSGDTYKDSQYDRVHRADMQKQLLEDLVTTIEELRVNEENRQAFQRQLDEGDPDAARNIEACDRKAQALKEKISKKDGEGRETGIIQRLKDFRLAPEYVTKLDIDRAESFADKKARVEEILASVKKDRVKAYKEMAKTVLETLDAKGPVDANSPKYTAAKIDALRISLNTLTGVTGGKKGLDLDDAEVEDEDLEKAMLDVKAYVKYVKDDIQQTQDRIQEYSDAIAFRNESKQEIERQQDIVKTSREEAERLRTEPVSDAQRAEWLAEEETVGEGENARRITARQRIEEQARATAEAEYRNGGSNGFTRAMRNFGFWLTHGFRSRNRMIAERAESLVEDRTAEYVNHRRDERVSEVEARGANAQRSLAGIETISIASRNDASVHTAAHRAAASITDENILSGENNPTVNVAEKTTAADLSNMGYDLALQKWRNGEIPQAEFDRILKEHLEDPDRKDRYAKPDETKGYTETPEYRNPDER